MLRVFTTLLITTLISLVSNAQDLSYYLPQDISYDENIPKPHTVLGHEVGAWHATHDKLVWYMKTLAAASPRVTLETYAHTYEKRPLLLLTITSPQNHQDLENIRQQHLRISDPQQSNSTTLEDQPVVVWMGYSVHGNEASGTNASLIAAYYLAAAQGPEIQQLLDQTIVLIDPSINPDGMNRFASWVNSHRSKNLDATPQSLEHNEAWPRGRTNHYWFDLNRDWLPLQHPESQGRLEKFHYWKPNVLTDHHEMGSNRTFFFQPGVPSRNHPLTPSRTFELTESIAQYHAKALDEIGSLYYSGEGYDDFYYGKGSTYPDVNGAVGILFEQASVRGHLRETDNGLMSFPFAIRNQFTTTLSTLQAAHDLRKELLEHQRNFYSTAIQDAVADPLKAFVFGAEDNVRNFHFLEVLRRHQIKVFRTSRDLRVAGNDYHMNDSYVVPLNQPQYRLIKAIFEQRTTFQDSLFYDVSAWTLPLAFNLQFDALDRRIFTSSLLGEPASNLTFPKGTLPVEASNYGYAFSWHHYYSARASSRLLEKGLKIKVTTENMTANGVSLRPGSILVPLQNQSKSAAEIFELMKTISEKDGVDIISLETGFGGNQKSWGSPTIEAIRRPKIVVVAEKDISGYEVGEVWHLLDQRFDIPMTIVSQDRIASLKLGKYNTLVMVNGQYKSITKSAKEKIKNWVSDGGTVIAWKNAAKWLADQKISKASYLKQEADTTSNYAYGDRNKLSGAQVIGGAIFEAKADLSHPLLYGYTRPNVPVFRNHQLIMERSKNPFTNPLMYTENPLLSGYISPQKLEKLRNTPAVDISHVGSGRVISYTDNPNFRAFWLGTNKLFLNAIFFGHIIESEVIK